MKHLKLVVPLLVSAGFATTAHAQAPGATAPVIATPATASSDASEPAPGPHAGAWSVSLGMPFDFTFAPSGTRVGMTGFSLGVGERLTDDWYLGGTGELGLQLGTSDNDIGSHTFMRGGLEARYIFNHGTGYASVNDGPYFPVPRTDWIGMRAGAESVDSSGVGGFAELSLGTDFWLGSTQVGIYLSGGLSVQRASVYAVPASATAANIGPSDDGSPLPAAASDPSSLTAAPYIAFGFRFAFS